MLFNSYVFVFVFFPAIVVGYYLLIRAGYAEASKAWLVLGSLFFYSWWHIYYLPLLLSSILVNFLLFHWLTRVRAKLIASHGKLKRRRKKTPRELHILLLALAFNGSLLGFFKYMDFFIENWNLASGGQVPLLHIALPLGISFFTLQQIAFQVDAYEGVVDRCAPLDYALFVSFFPQLVAGPIVHHQQMMPQFASSERLSFSPRLFFSGLWLFIIGLFKKVVVADTFAVWATNGFDVANQLSFFPAWAAALSYTFQLYFDFSGYCDMALGLGWMLGIKLPLNFDSPFRATSLTEFWTRWHMTLTAFITTYIYYPIARMMPKSALAFPLLATFLSMFVAGLWHGAAWTFVIFGAIHGAGLILASLTRSRNIEVGAFSGWLMTMLLIVVANVFFRATSFGDAVKLLEGMSLAGGAGIEWRDLAVLTGPTATPMVLMIGFLLASGASIFLMRNSVQLATSLRPTPLMALGMAGAFWVSIAHFSTTSPFLYFQF